MTPAPPGRRLLAVLLLATLALSGTASRSSAAASIPVSDTFQRTVTSGWGSAPVGGPYTFSDVSGAATSSVAKLGLMTVTAAGQSPQQTLASAAVATGSDTQVRFSLTRRPVGDDAHVLVVARAQGPGDGAAAYRVGVDVAPSGAVTLEAVAIDTAGVAHAVASAPVPGLTVAANKYYRLRVDVTGPGPSTLQAKVWLSSASEPAAWQLTATDTLGPQNAGAAGLRLAVGQITNAPITLRVSSLKVTNVAPATDTTPPSAPTGLALGTPTGDTIPLSWQPSTDDVGVTGYRVSLNGVAGATVTTTSYVFSGLTCGTTYQLGVAARDAAGNFSPTSTVSGATAACPSGDTTPPTRTPTFQSQPPSRKSRSLYCACGYLSVWPGAPWFLVGASPTTPAVQVEPWAVQSES